MTNRTDLLGRLLLYRQGPDALLSRLCCREPDAGAVGELVRLAVRLGWQGNLWHLLLTYSILIHENPFSLACERRKALQDTLYQIALQDMDIFRQLYALPPEGAAFSLLIDFHHCSPAACGAAALQTGSLSDALAASGDSEEFLSLLTAYYSVHGLGSLGLGQIFRIKEEEGHTELYPVEDRQPVSLDDLVGYESQKALLLKNTLAFLNGHHANNVLLYGDAGAGKSTSIQAIADTYADRGLRVIELYKTQFSLIPDLLGRIKNRNYRFILFMDDLSFEENEVEYKHLKSVMEGGAEAAPENVLIYATSNRRHLIRETWHDRSDMEHDGDIHRSDTVEEKLSLAGRFGLQIYYPNPSFEEYHTIVQTLAEKNEQLSGISKERLRAAASTWQVRHGSRSSRTAQQFINDLLCQEDIFD